MKKFNIYYESKKAPGVTLYKGVKPCEAETLEDAIEIVYQKLRETFRDRLKNDWYFEENH